MEKTLSQQRMEMDLMENQERLKRAEEKRKRQILKRTQVQTLQILFQETPTHFDLLEKIAVLRRNMLIADCLLFLMSAVNMFLLIYYNYKK